MSTVIIQGFKGPLLVTQGYSAGAVGDVLAVRVGATPAYAVEPAGLAVYATAEAGLPSYAAEPGTAPPR
jgi:hypothetical protein